MQAPSRHVLADFFRREWHTPSGWQFWLRPLSWLFRLAAAARRGLYRIGMLRTHRLGVPVIVVGNITVGGTGKTPIVIALVQELQARGYRPGIVTRGYVLKESPNPRVAIDVRADTENRSGDEPRLMAERTQVPIFAGGSRVHVGRALLSAHPEVDVIVCDDGLQHIALARDVEIAVIDGARGFGNGAFLPAGPLRESPDRLMRVDAIVVNRTALETGAGIDASSLTSAARQPAMPPVFDMRLGRESFRALFGGTRYDIDEVRLAFVGQRLHAVAGTGHPERFFRHLARLGFTLRGQTAFPDHHDYVEADFARLDADIVLVTEKDAVKLPLVARQFPQLAFWVMRVEAEIPGALYDLIDDRLARHARHVH